MTNFDLINAVSSALVARKMEQIEFASFLKALESNGKAITAESVASHLDALNESTKALWRALWNAHNDGLCHRPNPGKAPIVTFDAHRKCDNRCQHATGWQCDCSCGGANHGIFFAGQFANATNPAELVRILQGTALAEMEAINADPQRRMLIGASKGGF